MQGRGASRMLYSDVSEGHRKNQGRRLWRQQTRKSTSTVLQASYSVANTGSHANMHTPPYLNVHFATPQKALLS